MIANGPRANETLQGYVGYVPGLENSDRRIAATIHHDAMRAFYHHMRDAGALPAPIDVYRVRRSPAHDEWARRQRGITVAGLVDDAATVAA